MIHHPLLAALLVAALAYSATTARAGTMYASEGNAVVVTYDTDATNPTPTIIATFPGNSELGGLAFDTAGNLFVTSFIGNTISKITPGSVVSVFASGLSGPLALAFDATGNLYVTNGNRVNGQYTIDKFTPAGVGSIFASTGLNVPVGLAFDTAGNLFVVNHGNDTVEKFTPAGVGSVFASTGLSDAVALAFNTAGNLYVTSPGNGEIVRFTPSGVGSVFASMGLSYPNSLAFDAAGNLYVGDSDKNRILRFTPDGVGSVFANADTPAGLAFNPIVFGPSPIPEPSSLVLGFLALVSLGLLTCARHRLRRRTA
jgi:sugar lactone lactonase YvrE